LLGGLGSEYKTDESEHEKGQIASQEEKVALSEDVLGRFERYRTLTES